jgi:diguanylate cyclase (GGDEF)-like protein
MAQTLKLAQRDASGFSLLFIDLDRFKPINDTLGHEVGDLVLQEVSLRLNSAVRRGDTAARTGGDEFVILLQNTAAPAQIENVVNAILYKLSEPIRVGEHQLMIGASIGCARYPEDASDTTTLLKHADNAMYAAKCFGGNHFCFHDPLWQSKGQANLGLNLWQALERNEMHLVYQPQVNAEGHLRGCEALLRWNHPELGAVPPGTFIPIAETNGAILPIGDWVLETACWQLKHWQLAGLHRITMSVNVAARQLDDPGFADRVNRIVLSSGVAPQDLALEITESEALQTESNGYSHLKTLRAMGFKLAIDDFGTGYSSLSRLQFLPVDSLKIDQSFVQALGTDEKAQAISQCFVSMGLAMGMQVVAEGVETDEQHQTLKAQGCQLIQGYLTGRPMAPDALLNHFLCPTESSPTDDIAL